MSDEDHADTFPIVNELGLHARAAIKLAQVAGKFGCDVVVSRDGQDANAKSVMGLLLLCGAKGTSITVRARGAHAGEAVAAVGALVANKFGEGQ